MSPASFPWYQNFLNVSRAFHKNAFVADIVLIYVLFLHKQLKHTISDIFLNFDTICFETKEITSKINFPAMFSNLEKICIFAISPKLRI